MRKTLVFSFILGVFLMAGCASKELKARKALRDRTAANSGLFCDYVSQSDHPDVAVEVNLQMALRCDNSKSFSITSYRENSSEFGIVYCCAMKASGGGSTVSGGDKTGEKSAERSDLSQDIKQK